MAKALIICTLTVLAVVFFYGWVIPWLAEATRPLVEK
jgi:hypothetical protein